MPDDSNEPRAPRLHPEQPEECQRTLAVAVSLSAVRVGQKTEGHQRGAWPQSALKPEQLSQNRTHPTKADMSPPPSFEHVFRSVLAQLSGIVLPVMAAMILLPPDWHLDRENELLLHTVLETATVLLGAMVAVTLLRGSGKRPGAMPVVAVCLLAAAVVDFGHLYTYDGMPPLVTPSGPNKSIAFWLAARWLMALGMLAAAALPAHVWQSRRATGLTLLGGSVMTVLVFWAILFQSDHLPLFYLAGHGPTPAKVTAEYFIVALLVAAAGIAWARRAAGGLGLPHFLGELALMILTELTFTLFLQVTDAITVAGHVFKVTAYLMLYRSAHPAGPGEAADPTPAPSLEIGLARRLIEQGPVAMLVVDPNGLIELTNLQMEKLSGYGHTELVGEPLRLLLPDTAQTALEKNQRQYATTLKPWRMEFSLLHKDGASVDVEADFGLLETDGQTRMSCVLRDIAARKRLEEKSHRQHLEMMTLVDNSPNLIVRFDPHLRHVYVNAAVEKLTGLPQSAFIGLSWEEMGPAMGLEPSMAEEWLPTVRRVFQGGAPETVAVTYRQQGETHFFESVVVPEKNPSGSVETVLLIGRDTTARHEAEQERARLSQIIEMNPDVVTILRPAGDVIYLNRAGRKMFGLTPDQPLTSFHFPVLPTGSLAENPLLPAPQTVEGWDGETVVRSADGREVPVSKLVLFRRGSDDQSDWHAIILRDLTETKRYEAKLLRQATHDPLTGLPNRLLLGDRLGHAMTQAGRRGTQVAMMFIDLDLFKHVNDTLGHAGGDRLLTEVAHRLTHGVRADDTVARQGGDEFMVMIQGIERNEDLMTIAEKLLASVAVTPFDLDGHRIHVSASLGISLYPDDAGDADTLMRYADLALHRAKAEGRNTYRFFAAGMDATIRDRLALEEGLRNAVARKEFFVEYQPRVNLKTGEITSLEALVRWRHPASGMIAPGRFIPIAEEAGFIEAISEFVLREVCRQIPAWRAAGLPELKVSVNLSAREFQRNDLTQRISGILRETGLSPALLELEITESMVMHDPAAATRVLHDLKKIGVTLAMDDFGTGYSSFSHLKHFPLDVLKIDRSFVMDVTNDPRDASIVRTIIDIARNLGMVTVAEGGETEAQCAFLQAAGADELQGYYFSPPVSADAIAEMLRTGRYLDMPGPCITA